MCLHSISTSKRDDMMAKTVVYFVHLVLLGLILYPSVSDAWRRRRRRRSPPPNQPPSFIDCPADWTVYSTSLETIVVWSVPRAQDDRGVPTVTLDGPAPGTAFSEGRHSTSYIARDSNNVVTRCSFSFTVSIIRCPSHPTASHRWETCTFGRLGGSQCTFHCSDGYRRTGASTVHCNRDTRRWSASPPSCTVKTCSPALHAPQHGGMSCTDSNRYMSVCFFTCNEGYERVRTTSAARVCDGTRWSGTQPVCKDVEPPVFNQCPNSFNVNINTQSESGAVVTYQVPVASDNSGNANIVLVQGSTSGSRFRPGTTEVKYEAVDHDGNKAECVFNVNIIIIVVDG